MKERIDMLELSLKKEVEKRKNVELQVVRNELFINLRGAGHFWADDRGTFSGGDRDSMEQKELKKVLRLLAAGEKKINLKEREFRAFLSEKKTERNSKKVESG